MASWSSLLSAFYTSGATFLVRDFLLEELVVAADRFGLVATITVFISSVLFEMLNTAAEFVLFVFRFTL